jgi:AcrR family transcriptional regulator
MARNPDRTRKRLLDAAAAEFAAYGIAGARVDRIAEAAGVNKAMIYAYFGGKDQLFDAVFSAHAAAVIEQVAFDATDLPGYAGRLFDRFEDEPATHRLSTWYQLERPDGAPLREVAAANDAKLKQLEQAQRDGVLPDHFMPVALHALVRSTAMMWASSTHEMRRLAPDREYRRRAVVGAVRKVIAS